MVLFVFFIFGAFILVLVEQLLSLRLWKKGEKAKSLWRSLWDNALTNMPLCMSSLSRTWGTQNSKSSEIMSRKAAGLSPYIPLIFLFYPSMVSFLSYNIVCILFEFLWTFLTLCDFLWIHLKCFCCLWIITCQAIIELSHYMNLCQYSYEFFLNICVESVYES